MNNKMPRTPFSTPLSGSARETEIRIRNIMSGPKKRPPVLFLVLVFSVCIFCGNLVSCQVAEVNESAPDRLSNSQSGDVSLDLTEHEPAWVTYLRKDSNLSGEDLKLLETLFRTAERLNGYKFQSPTAQLMDFIEKDGWVLGAVFVEDHLENTLILGIMDKETGEVPHSIFQRSCHAGVPQVVTFRGDDGEYRLLYTFNGQENGQLDDQAGVIRFDGEFMAWEWPVEGDARYGHEPPGASPAAFSEYEAYWDSHLALLAPGGVDVYAVNPDFEWGKDDPWSIWQLDHNEAFWEAEETNLPIPIYFQSLSWLVGYTNDPGGWRVLSLKPNREQADLEARMDCFTLTACMDNGTGTFTADLFFSYDSEPSRPRSYSELVHAEVRAPLPSAAVPDPETRAAYVRVLENLLNNSILPDNSDGTGIFSDMADNTFAVADVDGDGREELVLLTRPNIYAGYRGYILEYYNNALVIQHSGFPSFTFYSNGAFAEDDSHAQGSWTSQFWPHSIYRYLPGSDSYELAGHVGAWEKVISDINPESLPPFPTEKDVSRAGILYYITPAEDMGPTFTGYSKDAVDQSVYLAWLEPILGDARPLELDYLPLTEENIVQFK